MKQAEMVPVAVELFFTGLKTEMDIFIQLSDDKYVLINKVGQPFDLERLKRYKTKQITHLHIRKDDYHLFAQKQISIAGIIVKNEKFPNDKKTEVLSKISESVYKAIETLGLDITSFEAAKSLTQHVINLVESDANLSKLFEALARSSEITLKHSIAVGFIAPMIGRHLQWSRTETLEKLSLGGLLHDIGEKELRPDILEKSRADMNYEELKEYESHPYRGMMILSSLKFIPEDIISIVYDHHENSMGHGFPRKLWDMKIHPLARVVALANTFTELTLSEFENVPSLMPDDAVQHIERVMGQPFNKEVFYALKRLLQKSPQEIKKKVG